MNFRMVSPMCAKNVLRILIWSALNLQITLGSTVLLTILIFQSMNMGYLFFRYSFISVTFCSFQCTRFLPPWLNLFLSVLFSLML